MRIVVDCGHGYNTSGKRALDGSMREWEFNNGVGVKVIEKLKGYKDVEILRVDDPTGKTDVPLATRTQKANEFAGKDGAYISIHGNAGPVTASGIETFAYTTKPSGSVKLANNVQKHLIAQTGRKNRGVKFENFHVLRVTNHDSILIEGGFFTNKEELALMKSESYREKVANGIVLGLIETYGLTAKPKPVQKPVSVTPAGKTKMVKVIYRGNDGVNVRQSPSFDSKVSYVAKFGEAFTVVSETESFYKLKSGTYITKAKEFVEIIYR